MLLHAVQPSSYELGHAQRSQSWPCACFALLYQMLRDMFPRHGMHARTHVLQSGEMGQGVWAME